ncbi:hypothetical protein, partial [Bacteroides uniformis]|uniref:hypothetical protein n=1 Tax=Bacteroides uniformis TaxID=820 RepID=UPI001AA1AB0D
WSLIPHDRKKKEFFNNLEEKDIQMHIEIGDDGRYITTGIGRVTFQRVSGKPIILKDAMHVPILNKNLVSVAMLEYC